MSHGSDWRGHWAFFPKNNDIIFIISACTTAAASQAVLEQILSLVVCNTGAEQQEMKCYLLIFFNFFLIWWWPYFWRYVPVGPGTDPRPVWMCRLHSSSLQSLSSSPSAHWDVVWLCAEGPEEEKKKGILSDFPLSTTLFFFFSFCADGSGLLCLVFTHSTLCSSLIILIHLSLGLLLELDDRHSVQVAVCPATIYTVLQQVLCR